MKREYTAPEAEIEMFRMSSDIVCGLSNGGQEGGDNPIDVDDDF